MTRLDRDPDYLAWRAAMADDDLDRPGCALAIALLAVAFVAGLVAGVVVGRWL